VKKIKSAKNKKTQQRRQAGFTLIELLISMAMVAILTGVTLQISKSSNTQKNLVIAANEVAAALREAQINALGGAESERHLCGFGVYVDDNDTSYKIYYNYNNDFKNNPDACLNNSDFKHYDSDGSVEWRSSSLPEGVAFQSSADVFFGSPYGEVNDSNGKLLDTNKTIKFDLSGGGGNKSITVNSAGKISF